MSVQEEDLRKMPLALQQHSSSSMSERQWQADLDEQHDGWSCSERRVIAAVEDYLEKCIKIKVEVAALELLMEPEEAEVCLRYILMHAKRRGRGIFEIKYEGIMAKAPPCPGEVDENAFAAAKLFFKQGGRKPVDFC